MNETMLRQIKGALTGALGTLAAVAALGLVPVALAGCSGDEGGGEGASCSTGQDCQEGFLCRSGTCVEKQGNNGGADAGDQDGTSENDGGGETIEDEDYAISYLVDDAIAGGSRLMVYKTTDGSHTQISPQGHDCVQGCWLSEDMATFVWAEAVEGVLGRFNIYKAPVSDLTVQGDGELVVENVPSARVIGNTLTYSKEQSGQFMAYYQPLDGGSEVGLGSLGTSASSTGGWFIAPDADTGLRYTYTPQTMDVSVGTLDGPLDSSTFTINAGNYQRVSGGYFGQSMPMSVSPDGKYAAFVTEAPNDYGVCETAADCSGPVQRCGRFNRCTAIELTVHIVELAKVDELGGPCGGEGTCGEVHTCDMPGDDNAMYTCIPKRVVLGMPVRPEQKATPDDAETQTGCELTEGNADYHYTSLQGPISFDNAGNLYGAAARDCAESGDVGDSDILKINPLTGEYEVVWGNPDTGYDPDACWNADEVVPSDESCVPYISAARLSPEKNELAFLATTPWVSEPRLAAQGMDVWTVKRDGTDHEWVGELESSQTAATELHVHPLP